MVLNPTRSIALFGQLQESLSTVPGVEAASAAEVAVFSDSSRGSNIASEGYVPAEGEDTHSFRNSVTPGYFATLGVPLVAEKPFTEQDAAKSQKVTIMNESLSRHYFGETDPVAATGLEFREWATVALDIGMCTSRCCERTRP